MSRVFRVILAAAVLIILGAGVVCTRSPRLLTVDSAPVPASKRPAEWAQPVELPGCPNLNKVTDTLYRGAQPTAEGFARLKQLGVQTIINLRHNHSDVDEMGDLKFNYIAIPMHAWHAEDEDIVAFLRAVTDKKNGVIFVHCEHGSDRTGFSNCGDNTEGSSQMFESSLKRAEPRRRSDAGRSHPRSGGRM